MAAIGIARWSEGGVEIASSLICFSVISDFESCVQKVVCTVIIETFQRDPRCWTTTSALLSDFFHENGVREVEVGDVLSRKSW